MASTNYQRVSNSAADEHEVARQSVEADRIHAIQDSFDTPIENVTDEEEETTESSERRALITRTPTTIPVSSVSAANARRVLPTVGNDGVFANMSAKPEPNSEKDEHPPTYEQASQDNAPPYWETTMYLPGAGDEVFIDGLAVGHVFGFIWNMLISMSFQFVGFLLTYILHTTHASKQGSRAGLGITLIQYGFYLKSPSSAQEPLPNAGDWPAEYSSTDSAVTALRDTFSGSHNELAAYALMLVGWFILIKSTASFLKVRRMESCVRETSTPAGGAAPVVAHNETPATAV